MTFFLTLLYLLVIFIRPQEFWDAIQGWPILDVMLVLCLGAAFLEGEFSAAKLKRSPLNKMILFFWLFLPITRIANFWFGGALDAFTTFAKTSLVYFLIVLTVYTFKRLRIFIWTLLMLTGVLSLEAIVVYTTGQGFMGSELLQRTEDIVQARGIGIFQDPNDLAMYLVTFMPFLLPAFHRPFLSPTSITGIIMLVPMATGVIYTRSRGGILGMAVVFWFYFYRRVGIFLSMGALALLISIVITLPRMGTINTQDPAARGRMEHWSAGLEMFKSRPLFGVGYGMFTEHHNHTAHNSFILILAEGGFIGAYLWVTIFFCAFREIYLTQRISRGPPFLDSLLDSLQGALLAWMVCGSFLSQTYKWACFIVLALIVAVLNSLEQEGISVQHPWSTRLMIYSFFLTIATIIVTYILLRLLWSVGL